jgi:hypothetical protein
VGKQEFERFRNIPFALDNLLVEVPEDVALEIRVKQLLQSFPVLANNRSMKLEGEIRIK